MLYPHEAARCHLFKSIIKKVFSFFGLGIYRLNSSQHSTRQSIQSPILHNTQERLNEIYSDPEYVAEYLSPERLEFYAKIANLLPEKGIEYTDKHIADVGCGTGELLHFIHENFDALSLTGLEYSEAALKICETTLPEAKFQYFDIYEQNNLEFNIIFCLEVLEHLLYPDKALINILSMISQSGIALITVPDGRIDTFEGHINFWSPESWEIIIKNNCNELDIEIGLINDKINFALIKRNYKQI